MRRWKSAREVQPDGRGGVDEILPSAEIAKLVEILGRSMAQSGVEVGSEQGLCALGVKPGKGSPCQISECASLHASIATFHP